MPSTRAQTTTRTSKKRAWQPRLEPTLVHVPGTARSFIGPLDAATARLDEELRRAEEDAYAEAERREELADRKSRVKAAAQAPVVVEATHVDKRFVLRHSRSMKEWLVWTVKGRKGELSETFLALDDVSFAIRQGEAVGLLGYNGSGKSTLLKLLSGVMLPDDGGIGIRGRVAGLIEVGAGFHPDLTGRENVFLNGAILGMTQAEIEAKFDEIVEFSEIEKFIDTEVKFYSSGMFLRLAFAVAAHSEPDIFLIDEILAVGDEPFQKKCLEKVAELREQGQTLVVVSHDLDMVQRVCDRGIVLERGTLICDSTIEEAVAHLRGPS